MTKEEIVYLFEKYDLTDYGRFDLVTDKDRFYYRPDLNAFALLHEMTINTDEEKSEDNLKNIIGSVQENEIYLNINIERWATEWCKYQSWNNDEMLEHLICVLVRCGVMYHELYDCLYMRF